MASQRNIPRPLLAAVALIIFASAYVYFQTPTQEYADVTVAEAKTLIEERPDMVILDVRTPSEFDDGHIEGAINIPVDYLAERLNELSKDNELLVYCRTGNRSARAVGILDESGFTKIFHMDAGITGWIDAGYPVVE
ncbi:rhodanese-like domain-containing protein [Candidatus Bathyarchaeota archaeon]|nr:rhodanese-like domain-containing protein [Candidatus Bathyarchaeota archaeon]